MTTSTLGADLLDILTPKTKQERDFLAFLSSMDRHNHTHNNMSYDPFSLSFHDTSGTTGRNNDDVHVDEHFLKDLDTIFSEWNDTPQLSHTSPLHRSDSLNLNLHDFDELHIRSNSPALGHNAGESTPSSEPGFGRKRKPKTAQTPPQLEANPPGMLKRQKSLPNIPMHQLYPTHIQQQITRLEHHADSETKARNPREISFLPKLNTGNRKLRTSRVSKSGSVESAVSGSSKKQRRVKWSKADLTTLWESISRFGNEWREVQKCLPRRTYHQVKDKGRRLLQKERWESGKSKKTSDGAKDTAKDIAQGVVDRIKETGLVEGFKEEEADAEEGSVVS